MEFKHLLICLLLSELLNLFDKSRDLSLELINKGLLGSAEFLKLSDPKLRISQLRGLAVKPGSLIIDDLVEESNLTLLALHELVAIPLSGILSEVSSSWGRRHRLLLFCLADVGGHLVKVCGFHLGFSFRFLLLTSF